MRSQRSLWLAFGIASACACAGSDHENGENTGGGGAAGSDQLALGGGSGSEGEGGATDGTAGRSDQVSGGGGSAGAAGMGQGGQSLDACLLAETALEGTACPGPDVVCGECEDPCLPCVLMMCTSEIWVRFEVEPNPESCGEGGAGGAGEGGTGGVGEGGQAGEAGSSAGTGGYEGGGCSYRDVMGQGTVSSIEEASASDGTLCAGTGMLVGYEFAPDDPSLSPEDYAVSGLGYDPVRFQRLRIPDAAQSLPPLACLTQAGVVIGTTFPVLRRLIVTGTCSPAMDSIDPSPLETCVGMCQ